MGLEENVSRGRARVLLKRRRMWAESEGVIFNQAPPTAS